MIDRQLQTQSAIRKIVRRLNPRLRILLHSAIGKLRTPAGSQRLDRSLVDAIADAIAEREHRHSQAIDQSRSSGRADWPPVYADPFPGMRGVVPEVRPAELTVKLVGGAIAHHGLLLVRGLLTQEQVAEVRAVQERVKAASLIDGPDDSGWYLPFHGKTRNEEGLRKRTAANGGNWLADSPLGLSCVIRHLAATGVTDILAEHFQERPALSLQKTVLRSIQPQAHITGWHQDGSFLAHDVRTMNTWIALSPCGGSTPASGIELIPRRLQEIIPIEPSIDGTAVSFDVVEDIKQETPSVLPRFDAGDALIFDQLLLHRTSLPPGLTDVRHALECWFFAPSHTNATYNSFLV